jgi:predicted small metal-binding protein
LETLYALEFQGGDMRAIDCPCGHHLEAADDEELFRLAREHVDRDHPEMQRTDDEIRERVAADAYAA